nr:secondary thiamine-phosphate synthase enzyme YjbQ [Aliamphritea spongicola]
MVTTLDINTRGQGLYEFTEQLAALVSRSGISEGLCTIMIRHTSASLCIQENADPSAQHDLERWLNRLVPENDSLYTHIFEGLMICLRISKRR